MRLFGTILRNLKVSSVIKRRLFLCLVSLYVLFPIRPEKLFVRWLVYRQPIVQVSQNLPIIDPIPRDLSRKTRREAHFDVQARLVHHGIDSALFLFGQLTYLYTD